MLIGLSLKLFSGFNLQIQESPPANKKNARPSKEGRKKKDKPKGKVGTEKRSYKVDLVDFCRQDHSSLSGMHFTILYIL